ncbi:MAG: NADH-quinone oxidoreductase subunit NuoH [Tepidisphaeraceae bacterium]
MHLATPILAQSSAPSNSPLVQSLVFEELGIEINPLTTTVWDMFLVATVFLGLISVVAMFCIWWERKVAGHMQSRIGPNRVGPFGLLQSLADGVKLLTKEDLVPAAADKLLFRLAPYLAFAPAFAAFLALPFAPDFVFEPNLNVGVFWILAILSVEVMGVILAGWASNNKWSVYGAMREACQMVSYEIPLGIAIIVGVMAAGTLNMVQLGHLQGGGIHTWLIYRNPFVFAAFFVYFIASLASNKRAPFDLPESESELVAGFHTEYSGLRWSFFFFAEYGAMFVVGGIQAALFLGAWHDPFGLLGYFYWHFSDPESYSVAGLLLVNVIGAGIFATKALALIFMQMWIRWTLPRPRIDQVLYACVKVLLPLSCVLLLGGAIWQWLIPERPIPAPANALLADYNPWAYFNPWNFAEWFSAGYGPTLVTQVVLTLIGIGGSTAVVMWVVYAIASGRNIKQRLTDPAPIDDVVEEVVTT